MAWKIAQGRDKSRLKIKGERERLLQMAVDRGVTDDLRVAFEVWQQELMDNCMGGSCSISYEAFLRKQRDTMDFLVSSGILGFNTEDQYRVAIANPGDYPASFTEPGVPISWMEAYWDALEPLYKSDGQERDAAQPYISSDSYDGDSDYDFGIPPISDDTTDKMEEDGHLDPRRECTAATAVDHGNYHEWRMCSACGKQGHRVEECPENA